MLFFITKSSRHSWTPYDGPACKAAGVPSGKLYSSEEEAQVDADKLSSVNPVGFTVSPYVPRKKSTDEC